MSDRKTVYFDKGGPDHTQATIEAAKRRAMELEPKPAAVIVASTSGKTGSAAARAFESTGVRVLVVPFQAGTEAGEKHGVADRTLKEQCERLGGTFIPDTPAYVFLDTTHPDIVAAWRVVSQGFKVALQVAAICVDLDLVEAGTDVIALGGSGKGADTAVLLTAQSTENALKMNVKEIIAMPCG